MLVGVVLMPTGPASEHRLGDTVLPGGVPAGFAAVGSMPGVDVDHCASCMLIRMQSTSVRIDGETHQELKRLAEELGTTVGGTVLLAVRALRQDRIGKQLVQPLLADESAWLDAELG